MSAQIKPQSDIAQLVEKILSSRKITRVDQRRFMSTALSKVRLSHDDQIQVNRVFDGLRSGLLKVVD
ncbi:hypothetical protein H6G00_23365 [Leptolyngbya sp. FACHB-541]|uniref:hypothetical protein n=1 Tax=Leptolyngbya sp. FACHB-541 TaxID=2692810 RepID=UPI001685689F|nr:hypothetical protein [Leptolyngbya sp. FACHB-541]MBD1999516.1 hypothetical protein [Leptolyngbya sp. FACHB-541]